MKKKIMIGVLGIAVLAVGYFTLSPNEEKVEATQTVLEQEKTDFVPTQEEVKKSETEIGSVTNEIQFATRMLQMTTQKTALYHVEKPLKNWGDDEKHYVQMTKGNINYMQGLLEKIEVEDKAEYETILNRWMDGNFEEIDKDVKTLLINLNDGEDPGYTVEKRDYLDEQTFILNNFGDEAMRQHDKEWNIDRQKMIEESNK